MKRKILNVILLLALAVVLIVVLVKPAQGLSMNSLEDYTIEEEQTLTFEINSYNYNSTVLFSKNLPQGTLTKINDSHAIFEWTPNTDEIGTYSFTFTASDNIESISKENEITVTTKNVPPVITNIVIGNQNLAQVQISITTNTQATCKYSLFDKNYNQMEYTFSSTNTEKTEHTGKTPALTQGSHTIYILCIDNAGNYMPLSTKAYLNVNLKPYAIISVDPKPPLREGTIKVELTASEDLISAPELKYSFDDDTALKNIALIGSGRNWEGYIIIKDTDSERVGSFTFKGTDSTNNEGSEITEGKIFLIDTLNPEAIQSITIENQDDRIKILWNKPDSENVKEYNIYKKTGTGGVEEVDQYSTSSSTSFYDRNVEYNEAYYYRVSVVDEAGNEGPLSKEVFITHAPVLEKPSSIITSPVAPENEEKLNSKLEYILELELQKVDKILLDMEKAEETLSRSLESDNIEAAQFTNSAEILTENKNKINELRNTLEDIKNSDIDEDTFNTKIAEITLQIENLWKNTPIELTVSDSASYQEFTNDEKTTTTITSYLGEYYSSLSQKETLKTIEEAKLLQDKLVVNVKIIKGEIKYPEETKPFSAIKKTYSSEESLEKMLLFEVMTDKVGKVSSAKYSEQPFYRDDFVFWKIETLNNKEIYYTIYSDLDMSTLKSVKSVIFDEAKLLEETNNMLTGQATSELDSDKEGGLMLSLIIVGVLIICGLFAYYVFWSETEDPNHKKSEQKIEIEQKDNLDNPKIDDPKKFSVNSTLFKKKKESIIPEDIHKKIEIEKPDESIHTQTDHIEFNRVLSQEHKEFSSPVTNINTFNNTSNINPDFKPMRHTQNNYDDLEQLQEKLEELKRTSKVDDLEDFDILRSKTYEIKRLCEELEEQSIIEFSNKTRAHLEKSLLYIAKNVPPEGKQRQQQVLKAQQEPKIKIEPSEEKQKDTKKNAPEWNEFILANGERIKNISELKEKLKEMTNSTFTNHVSGEKNDFASWIRDVFQDYELAHKVRTAQTKEEIIKILE
ncbi:MAG: hypothetical protein ACP5N2_06240 [Candidatus Nanoarchaeia archaeon]